jgi:uncharacterized membrane protein YobD (UPF0266 family)
MEGVKKIIMRRERKMKKTIFVMLIGILILGTVTTAGAGPFTWREARQQARIS